MACLAVLLVVAALASAKGDEAGGAMQEAAESKCAQDNAHLRLQNSELQHNIARLQHQLAVSKGSAELGSAASKRRGGRDKKRSIQNAAKCNHNNHDQSQVKGTLNCENVAESATSKATHQGYKGSQCPDDLSTGKYWMATPANTALCAYFTESAPISRQATASSRWKLITKAIVAHPNDAEKNVGVIGVKRIKEVDGDYVTFKTLVCIQCPASTGFAFANVKEKYATRVELKNFVRKCANIAFDKPGTKQSKLKSTFQCSTRNSDKAATLMKSF